MEAGGSECREHILEQLRRTSYLQDVGKVREQERKLEGSPSDGLGTNCTFAENAETIAKFMFRPDFQRTRVICGLAKYILYIAALSHPCDRGIRPPWMAEVSKMQEHFFDQYILYIAALSHPCDRGIRYILYIKKTRLNGRVFYYYALWGA